MGWPGRQGRRCWRWGQGSDEGTPLKVDDDCRIDRGYWYATDLKGFATGMGIASAGSLRKGELEKAIKRFLDRIPAIESGVREWSRSKDLIASGGGVALAW